jgi:hypothetical protein
MQSVPITTNVVSSNPAHGWRGVFDTTLCVCQWLAAGWWFSPVTQVSSTNKTDRKDKTETLFKVTLNTITLTLTHHISLIPHNLLASNSFTSIFIRLAINTTHRIVVRYTVTFTRTWLSTHYFYHSEINLIAYTCRSRINRIFYYKIRYNEQTTGDRHFTKYIFTMLDYYTS